MPNINLDDAYILDETGAQVDKVTGLFTKDEGTTEEEKAFAQLNIGASGGGGGGRNLLDNPFFTVNQRSASGRVLSNEYVADRWTVFGGSATAGTYPTINTSSNIGQKIAFSIEAGKTYTFSVLLAGGTIVSGTKTVTDPNTTISFISNSLVELDYFGGQSPKNIRIYNTSDTALGVKAAKIELGSASTLANDTPPDYDIELQKCKAAQLMLKNGAANFVPIGFCGYSSGTEARIFIPTTIEMWKASMKAAVAKTGEVVLNMNGQSIDITTLTLTDVLSNGVYVKGILATSVSPSYTLGALCLQANASILLDCNL